MGRPSIVGAYEAKTTFSALIDRVARGEVIVITKHDRPVARLVPFEPVTAGAELLARVRGLRGTLRLSGGETARDLIGAGRRL